MEAHKTRVIALVEDLREKYKQGKDLFIFYLAQLIGAKQDKKIRAEIYTFVTGKNCAAPTLAEMELILTNYFNQITLF